MRSPFFLLTLCACVPSVSDSDVEVPVPTPFNLADQVDPSRMIGHLDALQAIASANAGKRDVVSLGYSGSVDYVVDVLEQSGFEPQLFEFPVRTWDALAFGLSIVGPDGAARPVEGLAMRFSAGGEVEAGIVAVDLQIPPGPDPNSSTSGCEATDFEGFPYGSVALVQRGFCPFADKVKNAAAAGASAVLIFNEGQADRTDVPLGHLIEGELSAIPAVGIAYADGVALASLEGARVRLSLSVTFAHGTDQNVLVTIPGRDRGRVVVIGAHLDSVAAGPGINDNGSGTALLLDIAERAAAGGWQPETDVRLAWWGAEEIGLVGSSYYFLTEGGEANLDNLKGVEAYLNFDMLGSPNGVRFIYDGDGSTGHDLANPGSAYIEGLFEDHFAGRDLPTHEVAIFDRSDSFWAVVLGIPWGGLFSGADILKTEAEVATQGGAAGEPHDPCYHQACDTVEGVDPTLYGDLARAAAAVLQQLAESPTRVPGASLAVPGEDPTWTMRRDLPKPMGCHGDPILPR